MQKKEIQNIIESLASVYGIMSFAAGVGPQTLSGSWENLTLWDNSRDTRGVQDDLIAGWYTIKAGGGGRWAVHARVTISADTAGTYKIRPRIVYADDSQGSFGGNTTVSKALGAGESWLVELKAIVPAAALLDTGDHLAVQVDGPAGAEVSGADFSYFEVDRK